MNYNIDDIYGQLDQIINILNGSGTLSGGNGSGGNGGGSGGSGGSGGGGGNSGGGGGGGTFNKLVNVIENLNTALEQTKSNLKTIYGHVKHMVEPWAEVDNAASKYAKTIAMTEAGMKRLRKATIDNVVNARIGINYNVSPEELIQYQQKYAQSVGRALRIDNTQQESLAAMHAVMDGRETELAAAFENFGVSLNGVADHAGKMFADASKNGLSFEKYSDNVAKNIKIAQNYTFKNGLKGLESMAKKATAIKLDMGQVASFAEKVSTIEGAIDVASKLQVLGGSFAGIADPLGMLNEGLMDMEGLTDRVIKMVGGMGAFNRQTGEVEVSAFNKQRIKAAAQAMGMDYSQLMESVNAGAKREEITRQISASANATGLNNDMKELIKNSATFNEEGKAGVSINGQFKTLDELSNGDYDDLIKETQDQAADIKDIARTLRGFKDMEEGTKKQYRAVKAQHAEKVGLGEGLKSLIGFAGRQVWLLRIIAAGSWIKSIFGQFLGGVRLFNGWKNIFKGMNWFGKRSITQGSFGNRIGGNGFFGKILNKLSGKGGKFGKIFDKFGKIGSKFTGAFSKVVGKLSGVGEKLGGVFSKIFIGFGGIGSKIGGAFTKVFGKFSGIGGKIGGALSKVFGKFSGIGGRIGGALSKVFGKFSGIGGKIGGALSKVFGKFSGIGGKIGGALSKVFGNFIGIVGKIGSALSKVFGKFSGIGGKIGGALSKVFGNFSGIVGKIGGALSKVFGKFSGIGGKIGGALSKVFGKFSGVGGKFGNKILERAGSSSIKEFAGRFGTNSITNVSKLGTKLSEKGFTKAGAVLTKHASKQAAEYGMKNVAKMGGKKIAAKTATKIGTKMAAGVAKGGVLGIVGAAGNIATDMLIERGKIKKGGAGHTAMKVGSTALEGAALGATIGSVFPGIGTAIGTAVGAIGGAVVGAFKMAKVKREARVDNKLERMGIQRKGSYGARSYKLINKALETGEISDRMRRKLEKKGDYDILEAIDKKKNEKEEKKRKDRNERLATIFGGRGGNIAKGTFNVTQAYFNGDAFGGTNIERKGEYSDEENKAIDEALKTGRISEELKQRLSEGGDEEILKAIENRKENPNPDFYNRMISLNAQKNKFGVANFEIGVANFGQFGRYEGINREEYRNVRNIEENEDEKSNIFKRLNERLFGFRGANGFLEKLGILKFERNEDLEKKRRNLKYGFGTAELFSGMLSFNPIAIANGFKKLSDIKKSEKDEKVKVGISNIQGKPEEGISKELVGLNKSIEAAEKSKNEVQVQQPNTQQAQFNGGKIDLNISGTIKLEGANGKQVDITKDLLKDSNFIREITKLITQRIGEHQVGSNRQDNNNMARTI